MSEIIKIEALEVLDSRGNPTVQVEVFTKKNGYGKGMVPSGSSTGSREAIEIRDKGTLFKNNWYGEKGVQTAIKNIEILSKHLIGLDVTNQTLIDQLMIKLDGTENKSKFGANAILGISIAVLRAAANELKIPLYRYIGGTNAKTLPVPMVNIINGGDHASNTLDIQEFMIVPLSAKNFREAMQMSNKVFHNLGKLLKQDGYEINVGDEGGYAPNLKNHDEAFCYIIKAIEAAGFKAATKGEKAIAIAIDVAASEFYNEKEKKYFFKKLKKFNEEKNNDKNKIKLEFTTKELNEYYIEILKKYPVISIEDGFAESDWDGFKKITSSIGEDIQIVGDDLTVTNSKILEKAIKEKAINSILIKLNQIGTVTETIETIEKAHKAGYTSIISHRSGETEDSTIADLAVGINSGQIKTGSISRTDRIVKYNRLLNIENELKNESIFLGEKAFKSNK